MQFWEWLARQRGTSDYPGNYLAEAAKRGFSQGRGIQAKGTR